MKTEDLLSRLVSASSVDLNWFSPSMRTELVGRKVEAAVNGFRARYGRNYSISHYGDKYYIDFPGISIPIQVSVDSNGLIGTLYFLTPTFNPETLGKIKRSFLSLPGNSSAFMVVNDIEVFTINPDELLAVGSAFKILIMRILVDSTLTGNRQLSDTAPLRKDTMSFGGVLEKWPIGTPITVATLAGLMLALSDNTATDTLMHYVGRRAIERLSPKNVPFLTTREMYLLKYGGAREFGHEYVAGDIGEKRRILRRIKSRPIIPADMTIQYLPQIEWFFSVRELCDLMASLHNEPLLQINAGPFSERGFSEVSFKAGREPGVVNYTAALKLREKRITCSATWNHPHGTDEEKFLNLFKRLVISGAGEDVR